MLALVATFASICGFLFGYDLGLIGGALLNIRDAFGIGDVASEAIVGAAKFGAFFGTFLGGAAMLKYGRRRAIALDSLFFIVGPVLMAASAGVTGLVVGRVIVGLGIGISAVVVPSYLGEVAPAKVRGRVVETYELLLCAGMLAALLGDAAFQGLPGNWRWMVGAPVVPALLLSLSLCLLPESPRWLVIRGQLDAALAVIHRVYTSRHLPAGMQHSTAEVEEELLQLWSSVEKDRAAAAARLAQHAERARRRAEQRATKVAPLGSGSGGDGGGSPQHGGGWQRLQAAEGEGQGEAAGAATGSHAAAVEAGAAGVQQRMQAAVEAESGKEAGGAEVAALLAEAEGGAAAGARGTSPVRVPPHLPRIRTATSELQEVGDQAEAGLAPPPAAAPAAAAAPVGGGTALRLDEWGGGGALDPAAAAGRDRQGGEAGFWATLGGMLRDIHIVACGPERQALQMSLWLAFFNQAFASTSIVNYAPQVLERAGVESHSAAMLMSSSVGATKLAGVLLSLLLVDSLGRRPLLLWGSLGCAASLGALAAADWLALKAFLVASMCLFIFAFSVSWAGVFWVLLSELFSMSAKSPAASAATATLFLTGAVADTVFLTLHDWLGPAVFLMYAALAAAAGLYVAAVVPETKGRSLQEVQALLALRCAPGSRRRGWWPLRRRGRDEQRAGLLPAGAVLSDASGGGQEGGRVELSQNP